MRKKEIITCECGATLKRGNLWNHRKLSKIHRKNKINHEELKKYIKFINAMKKIQRLF